MCSFLVALLHMFVVRRDNLKDYWSTDPLLICQPIKNLISRDAWFEIWRYLLISKEEPGLEPPPLDKSEQLSSQNSYLIFKNCLQAFKGYGPVGRLYLSPIRIFRFKNHE